MKRLIAIIAGSMFFTAAHACNWDRQDCSDQILGEAVPKLNWLRQQPGFNEKHGKEIENKARQTDINAKTCNSRRGCNQVYNDFAGLINIYYYQYQREQKATQQAEAPKALADKWAGQCVVAAKSGVVAYVDQSGASKTGPISEYIGYTVTQTADKFVGLKVAESGKFVGWAKKSELQMQDLRNCN